jgi:hypothetical protein
LVGIGLALLTSYSADAVWHLDNYLNNGHWIYVFRF